jgi:cyclopropane-fatty-acyl-phospholipid synthase
MSISKRAEAAALRTHADQAAESAAPEARGLGAWVARRLQRHMRYGGLAVRWPDGGVSRITGPRSGPDAEVQLHSWRGLRRLIFGGSIGLAEAYMAGEWDSPDLATAVELAAMHRRDAGSTVGPAPIFGWATRLRHSRNANSRTGSRRNIAFHYDLGNDFYGQWLDPTMLYSSAVFTHDGESLEAAQINKCRRLLSLLDPQPGQSLLEIGCGWGTFARLAAKERGVSVTAITLSQEQHDYARQKVFEDGLADKINVVLRDYRDVTDRYDHVASIEMFEAVGEKYWPVFFAKVRDGLNRGGRAAMQIITIDDRLYPSYRKGVDFIQRYIFPGGMLPSTQVLRQQAEKAGLLWAGDTGFGLDYAKTLGLWRERFVTAWADIAKLGFDERFKRMWALYLAYCEGGFRAGNIDVRQVAFQRT